MKTALILLLAAALFVPSLAAACGPYQPGSHLEFGVDYLASKVSAAHQEGTLTPRELRIMEGYTSRLRTLVNASLKDGRLSRGEERTVQRRLKRARRLLDRLEANSYRTVASR